MTIKSLERHIENNDGYCTSCKKWTRHGETEPDARNYPCPKCKTNSVIGAEEVLFAI